MQKKDLLAQIKDQQKQNIIWYGKLIYFENQIKKKKCVNQTDLFELLGSYYLVWLIYIHGLQLVYYLVNLFELLQWNIYHFPFNKKYHILKNEENSNAQSLNHWIIKRKTEWTCICNDYLRRDDWNLTPMFALSWSTQKSLKIKINWSNLVGTKLLIRNYIKKYDEQIEKLTESTLLDYAK